MIRQIRKIKKYQIFNDYFWPEELQDFKKYNLIYGWNGSGKTTFSNFLRQIEKKQVARDCSEFEIITENGIINQDNCSSTELKIKVFNRDFIDDTIFPLTGNINPIFIIGEKEKNKIDVINEIKSNIERINLDSNECERELESISKDLEKICRNTARTIKQLLRSSGSNRYNNYECPNLKEKIKSFDRNSIEGYILSEEKINDLSIKIKSTPKPFLEEVTFNFREIEKFEEHSKSILDTIITSNVINRLKDDSILNQWVLKGVELTEEGDKSLCPFCEQIIPKGYLDRLEQHFNDSYNSFLSEIDGIIKQISVIKLNLSVKLSDESRFYEDLSVKYSSIKNCFEENRDLYMEFFNSIVAALEEKRMNPFKRINIEKNKSDFRLPELIKEINIIIQEHNGRSNNFSIEIDDARSKLENHIIVEIFVEYIDLEKKKSKLNEKIKSNSQTIEEQRAKIFTFEQDFLTHSEAARNINRDLANFLNRKEIELSVKEYGYEITRDGIITNRLSEGEKTAISFIYFLNSLKDRDFDITTGIVVIDDPISSFDSLSLFNAFAFMKNNTENAHQLFVLTHNFSFFNEVKKWMTNKQFSSHYMLKNSFKNNKRNAYLAKLDDLLKKYHSEYHFLFSIVFNAAKAEDMELKDCYPLPNISRKLLESFLAFRKPNDMNLKDKLMELNFDESKKLRIYQFIQEKSHANYISNDEHDNLSPLGETQSALQDILKLIEESDPDHFKEMKNIIEKNNSI